MATQKARALTDAEINHLRRLVAYVRCEIGPEPDEHLAIARDLAAKGLRPDAAGIARLAESHQQLVNVPQYVRAGVKALTKVVRRRDEKGPPLAEEVETPRLPAPDGR